MVLFNILSRQVPLLTNICRNSKVRMTYQVTLQRENKGGHLLSQFSTTCTGTIACAIAGMPHAGFQLNFSSVLTLVRTDSSSDTDQGPIWVNLD